MVGLRWIHPQVAFINELANDAEVGRKLEEFAEKVLLEQLDIQMPKSSGCLGKEPVIENNNWRKSKRGFNGYNRSY